MSDKKREIEIVEISQVMSTKSGRNVITRLLEMTGIDENTFSENTHLHAQNAGRREMGLWLRDELKEACFSEYLLMLKESNDG